MLAKQRTLPPNSNTSMGRPIIPTTTTTASAPTKAPPVHYEVDCFDVHVINADYRFAAPASLLPGTASSTSKGSSSTGPGVRLMMMLTVSGTVSFGADREALKQHFHDVFILVPNWDAIARHGLRANKRSLIASHTYRAY